MHPRWLDTGMPTIMREKGYSVKIFVAEQAEPAHVHVSRDDAQVNLKWKMGQKRLALRR